MSRQLLQIVSFAALARLLTPADFGQVAMLTSVVGFLTVMATVGFESSIVHADRLDPQTRDSLFYLAMAWGLMLSIAIALLAWPLAWFFKTPELAPLALLLAPIALIQSVGTVSRGSASRALDFRRLFVTAVLGTLVGIVVAVALAWQGHGAVSIVLGQIVTAFVSTSAITLWERTWPRSGPAVTAEARAHVRYVRSLLGFTFVNYWARSIDNLLVGRVLGPSALGIYDRSYQVSLAPLGVAGPAVGRVMTSAMSRTKHDTGRTARIYLQMTQAVVLVLAPAFAVLAVLADPFVAVLFGPQWADAVPVVRLLALVGLEQILTTPTGSLYQALGRTDTMFRVGLASSAVLVAGIVVGVAMGTVTAVAACYAVASTVAFLPVLHVTLRLLDTRLAVLARAVVPIYLAAAGAAAVAYAVSVATAEAAAIVVLLASTASACFAFLALALLIARPAVRNTLQALAGRNPKQDSPSTRAG